MPSLAAKHTPCNYLREALSTHSWRGAPDSCRSDDSAVWGVWGCVNRRKFGLERDAGRRDDSVVAETPIKAGSERRRSGRVPANKLVVVRWAQSETERREESSTIMLSLYGCAVHTADPLPPGTRVTIEYAGKSREGRVLYTLVNHTAGTVEMAVGFDEAAADLWDDVEF